MNLKKVLLAGIVLVLSYFVIIQKAIIALRNETELSSFAICAIVILLTTSLVWFIFRCIDKLYPSPKELNMGDVKRLRESKIFWMSFITLIVQATEILFEVKIEPGLAEEVVNIDWGNATIAIASLMTIVFRKYDTTKKINGV